MSAREKVPDAFWNSDIGFVCEKGFVDAQLPGTSASSDFHFDEALIRSGRLPDLKGAPVASWVLARFAKLAGRRFPYERGEVSISMGGVFWLRVIAFTSDFRPLGTVSILGSEHDVALQASISPASELQKVTTAFTDCLLAEPCELARCRLIVANNDPNHWQSLPFVFGWDGNRFFADHAPEHSILPEDCDGI